MVDSNECFRSEALQSEVMAVFADPAFAYEAREHIAYCFNCVGRSLAPEQQAVLMPPARGGRHRGRMLRGYQRRSRGPTSAPNPAVSTIPSVYHTATKAGDVSGHTSA